VAQNVQKSRQSCRLPSGVIGLKTTADKMAVSCAGVEKIRSMSRQEADNKYIPSGLSIYESKSFSSSPNRVMFKYLSLL